MNRFDQFGEPLNAEDDAAASRLALQPTWSSIALDIGPVGPMGAAGLSGDVMPPGASTFPAMPSLERVREQFGDRNVPDYSARESIDLINPLDGVSLNRDFIRNAPGAAMRLGSNINGGFIPMAARIAANPSQFVEDLGTISGSALTGNPIAEELSRPVNLIPFGKGVTVARAATEAVGGRLAVEAAQPLVERLPEQYRGAADLGINLAGQVATGAAYPRIASGARALNAATDADTLRAVPGAREFGRGKFEDVIPRATYVEPGGRYAPSMSGGADAGFQARMDAYAEELSDIIRNGRRAPADLDRKNELELLLGLREPRPGEGVRSPSAGVAQLGKRWPTAANETPASSVTLKNGRNVVVESYGDGVGRDGYNGGFLMRDADTGKRMGYIEYQSAANAPDVTIAMVRTEPQFQRQGVADTLLERLRTEFPGKGIDPGMVTPQGNAWFTSLRRRGIKIGRAKGRTSIDSPPAFPFGGARGGAFTPEEGGAIADLTRRGTPSTVQRSDISAPYTAPPTLRRLFGASDIAEGQQRGILERVGMEGRFRPDDPIVTPALRVRDEARQAVTNQATRVTAQARTLIKRGGFDLDENGRVASLAGIDPTVPGAPTLRDVAARYPTYAPYLTDQQRQALEAVRDLVSPYRQALDEVVQAETQITGKPSSIKLGSRPDVMDGGFYIPRGNAETDELADIASQRLARGGGRPGKQGFEKSATFASEAEGIEAGYKYTPFDESLESYVKGSGNRALDRHTANYFLTRVDETGKRLAETRADRIDPELPALVQGLRQRISGRLQTLRNQTVRGGAQQSEAQRYERLAERLADLTDRARGRAGSLPTAQEARALDTEAAAALREAVTRGRTLTRDLTNLQRTAAPLRAGAQRTTAEITSLTDELAQALEQADSLTGRGREQIRRFGGDAAGLPPEAAFEVRTAQARYADSLRAADRVQKAIERLAERATRQESALEAAGVKRSTLTELRNIATSDVSAAIADLRAAGNTDAALRVAQRELRVLENQARQAGNRAGGASARAGRTAANRQRTIDEITALRAELDELTPRYQRAQEAAAQTPRDAGSIPLKGLEAYSFPWEMADEAARILQRENIQPGQMGAALRAVNSIARGVQATGEASYLGIQNAIGSVADPVGFGRSANASTRAWLNSGDEVLGDYLMRFDAKAAQKGLPTTERWAASGLRLAESGTEFKVGRKMPTAVEAVTNAPGVKQALAVPKSLVKRADRGFGVAGDTMRLELADTLAEESLLAGRTLDAAELKKIAESANRATGWTPQRAFGDWGEAMNFAPRYLAARVRTLGQLASADPRKRQIARRLVGRYIAFGTTATIAANALNGEETDFRPFSGKNGPTFDPREAEYKNPNFMRVMNVANRDWSLLGPVDATLGLAIGLTSLATNPTGDPKEAVKRLRSIITGPLASAGLDWFVFGEDFDENKLTLDSPEGQKDIMRRIVPFAAPDLAESAIETAGSDTALEGATEAAGGIVQGFFGGRAARVTPRERVERGEYADLKPVDQLEAQRAETWGKVKYGFGGSTEQARTYGVWRGKQIEENVKAFQQAGVSRAEAQRLAEKVVDDDPVTKAYTKLRNDLEDEWGVMNPKEAAALLDKEADLPEMDRTFRPTKKVREFIEASR